MNRLRQHQQVRGVMVNVSRIELRPLWILTNLGRKDWNKWNDVPVHIKKDIESIYRKLQHPSIPLHGETLSRSEGKRGSD